MLQIPAILLPAGIEGGEDAIGIHQETSQGGPGLGRRELAGVKENAINTAFDDALVELVAEREPGLLVFGPDRSKLRPRLASACVQPWLRARLASRRSWPSSTGSGARLRLQPGPADTSTRPMSLPAKTDLDREPASK